MVDRNLIREFNVEDVDIDNLFGDATLEAEIAQGQTVLDELYNDIATNVDVNQIIEGKIIRVDGDEVLVDIGYKSEGIVFRDEWAEEEEEPVPGQTIQVLLDEIEDALGFILLSKRKADRIREWEKIIQTHKEGDIITGAVVRKIKGGLLVNIGVNVFLPASQVDIRRPSDIADFIGQDIELSLIHI